MLAKSKLAEFIAAKTSADRNRSARRENGQLRGARAPHSLMRICTRR